MNQCEEAKKSAVPLTAGCGDAQSNATTVSVALRKGTMEHGVTSTHCSREKGKNMNSKQKGSRGERQCRDIWKKHGYEEAHRSQQYSGRGESSADIEGIDPRLHIEVKSGYSFKTIYTFLEQAVQDAKEGEIPIVNCKMDRMPWLWVCYLDDGIEMWKNQAETIPIIPMELKKEFHIDDIDENRRSIFEDIVYVTRCKDCKNWRESHSEDEESYCYIDGRTTDSTDYCSWGERR